jgi:hypothetical protein
MPVSGCGASPEHAVKHEPDDQEESFSSGKPEMIL